MEENIEIWKSLEFLGYPNYEVSTLGNVKSLSYNRTGKEKLLKPKKDKDGYLQVHLSKDNKIKHFRVHRLVAKCFLEPIEGKDIVNHKDENPSNNHVENLEFCTQQYNVTYNNAHLKKGKKISKPIIQYTLDGNFIREWESITQVNKELNIDCSSITKCCKGKLKTSKGFIWRYKE